ncbi:DUF4142 domain-containing protein [Nocardia sp. NPDC051756]|uniref:DUF4142 domain-containing protein n=1 Tax=Nocardia sp. NPDC051756 TaxID=3154751 RepID=UPI0034478231
MHSVCRIVLIAVTITALEFSAAAHGSAEPPDPVVSVQPSPQDSTYLIVSHQANLAEIISGTQAAREGTCALVRTLGVQLVADHTRLDAMGVAVAIPNLVPLPLRPNPDQAQQIWDTGLRIGRDFDMTWLRMQEDFHRQSLQAGARQLRFGTVEAVTALARNAEPTIDHHLTLVREALEHC